MAEVNGSRTTWPAMTLRPIIGTALEATRTARVSAGLTATVDRAEAEQLAKITEELDMATKHLHEAAHAAGMERPKEDH